MRVIMMGTGPFAVPTFKSLYDSPHEVLALITRPDRPQQGRTKTPPNPMRALAVERGTPVHDPESINTSHARMVLASYQPDIFVVCDYGQILKPEALEIARLGGINLHASLLPKYRGAAPINWALYHGEAETGITVIHMTPQLDAGPAIAIGRLAIGTYDTAAEIEPRLAELGAPLVLQAMAALEAGTAKPIVQDPSQATKAPRLKKELGAIDWTRPAVAIKDQIRALQPWPKSFTFWRREGGEPIRLIVERVRLEPGQQGEPGKVLTAAGETLVIATGAGALAIEQIQPAGKRTMSAGEFLRGNPIRPGDRFAAQ